MNWHMAHYEVGTATINMSAGQHSIVQSIYEYIKATDRQTESLYLSFMTVTQHYCRTWYITSS